MPADVLYTQQIRDAARDALLADAGIVALVGDRVFSGALPVLDAETDLPAIGLQLVAGKGDMEPGQREPFVQRNLDTLRVTVVDSADRRDVSDRLDDLVLLTRRVLRRRRPDAGAGLGIPLVDLAYQDFSLGTQQSSGDGVMVVHATRYAVTSRVLDADPSQFADKPRT